MCSSLAQTPSLHNPPLVEVIAQLQWGTPTTTLSCHDTLDEDSTKYEELFKAFADKVSAKGYTQSERILPLGIPFFPFRPTYKYFKSNDSSVFQLGAGIFSVNITPPYERWIEFRKIVALGIESLLGCLPEHEKKEHMKVKLRYINAFKRDTLTELSLNKFLTEILKFKIHWPSILLEQAESSDKIKVQLDLVIPLKSGLNMELFIAEGSIINEEAMIMDIATSITTLDSAAQDKIMNAFDSSHEAIATTFFSLIAPLIPDKIRPKEK